MKKINEAMINEKLKELYASKIDGVKQLANSLDDPRYPEFITQDNQHNLK